MTSNSAAPRVAAVELPADPQSPLYSAPTYEAVQTGNTGSAAGQGTTGATGTAPLSDQLAYATSTQQTALSHRNLDFYDLPEDDAGLVAEPADAQLLSADSQQQTTTQPGSDGDIPTAPQAPPATLHPDAPPAYLDAPHDASEPPTYVPPPPAAPAVTPSEAARAAAALHAADPAKTMQSQSWAQIFESMREPGRAGLLYWAFVADILFAILIGLALLAYSVKPLAWRYYGGINGNATNEAYVALWGACITNNATGVADCSFTWGTNAFKNYYSQSLLFAVPTVPTFSWFCVMTIGFLTAGLLHDLWAGWINILGSGLGMLIWFASFPLVTWFMLDSARVFSPVGEGKWLLGFYFGCLGLVCCIASLVLKGVSLRYKVKTPHSAVVGAEVPLQDVSSSGDSGQGESGHGDSGHGESGRTEAGEERN